MIAAITENSEIKLWNLKRELLYTFKANADDVSEVIFSPDNKTIISIGGYKGKTKLWNIEKELPSSLGYTNNVVFSPDGQILASANEDSTIKLWTLKGKLLQTLEGHMDGVSQVMFSPDGQTITSISKDNTIKSWTLKGKLLRSLNANTDNLVFSPDNQTIISYDQRDSNVQVSNLEGKLLYTLQGHVGGVVKVVFSPDGQTIATLSGDSLVKLWNLQKIEQHCFILFFLMVIQVTIGTLYLVPKVKRLLLLVTVVQ
ncbi:MAG: WD40 repeat domain-containing protein [Pleurocapsa sp. SU_5_0]|nr:WD40 repeat domain-containing protein [Pleurocapsa sp. SU_5_0]